MPALVEREEISPAMQEALRHHIIREREKKKREEKEAEKDFERRAKIEEERRRKEEEDSVTLEQIKEQLSALHKRQEKLKSEKHQLFSQLKKVLQEEERKKQQKLKEQADLAAAAASHGHYQSSLSGIGGYQMLQGGHYPPHHQVQYLNVDRHSSALPGQSSPHLHPSLRHSINSARQASPAAHQGVKRPHSPVSPQPSPIQMYQRSALAAGHGHLPSTPQHPKYDHAFAGHSSSHLGIPSLPNAASTQSSIHGTPSRHISVLHNATSPSGRPSGSRSPYSLGKQLEIASQKSGFGDETGTMLTPPRGRPTIRMLPQAPPSLIPQPLSSSPRSRSGSPGRYPMHPEKSRSPLYTNPIPGTRYYK